MRSSTGKHLNVPVMVASEADEDTVLEKEEPVFVGLLGLLSTPPSPSQLTSFPGSTLKQEEILTPPNGDFVNPPNVTVTHSLPIALPFSYTRSPYLSFTTSFTTFTFTTFTSYTRSPYLSLLSSSDIDAVLCEAANNDCQQ